MMNRASRLDIPRVNRTSQTSQTSRTKSNMMGSITLCALTVAAVAWSALLVKPQAAQAAEPVEPADPTLMSFAKQIATLRHEVETLSTELTEIKETKRGEAQSYSLRKTDLDTLIQRERLKVQRLQQQIETARQKQAKNLNEQAFLKPVLSTNLQALSAYIEQGLPFMQAQRLKAVNDLAQVHAAETQPPDQLITQLWALIEDELRLIHENAWARQSLEINGEPMLVDVVRLGMSALFFRTLDNRYGYLKANPSTSTSTSTSNQRIAPYSAVWVKSEQATQQMNDLFAAFKRGQRSGAFQLPRAAFPAFKQGES